MARRSARSSRNRPASLQFKQILFTLFTTVLHDEAKISFKMALRQCGSQQSTVPTREFPHQRPSFAEPLGNRNKFRMFARRVLATAVRLQNVRSAHAVNGNYQYYLDKIGNREIVGYGYNGDPVYLDRWDVPMPAIRFKETTPDIKILREKEKGDWKQLTVDEKKALYRASFCQTFAEMNAPDGEWKATIGWGLIYITLSLWLFVFLNKCVYPPLPETFSEERRQAQYDRMMVMNVNPITGFSSHKFQEE